MIKDKQIVNNRNREVKQQYYQGLIIDYAQSICGYYSLIMGRRNSLNTVKRDFLPSLAPLIIHTNSLLRLADSATPPWTETETDWWSLQGGEDGAQADSSGQKVP